MPFDLFCIFFFVLGMCDFQYLPMKREENGSYQNLLDQLVLKTITPSREYLSREGPLFIPPMIFSRMDTPQDYNFRSDRGHRNVTYDPNVTRPPDVIGSGDFNLCLVMYKDFVIVVHKFSFKFGKKTLRTFCRITANKYPLLIFWIPFPNHCIFKKYYLLHPEFKK